MDRTGIRFIRGSGDLRNAEDKDLAFSSPEYQNLMIYEKGIESINSVTGHDLGYIPTFDAYAKWDGKYFVNYNSEVMTNYEFENGGAIGYVRTGFQQINVNVDGGEIAWLMYANPNFPEDGSDAVSYGRAGAKFSKEGYSLHQGLGRRSFDSGFEQPLVIGARNMSVSLPSLNVAANNEAFQTAFVDWDHGQNQANHILSPSFMDGATFALLSPYGTGFSSVRQDVSYELYVDATKIRLRLSRHGLNFLNPSPITFDPVSATVPVYLTNIKLP